MLSRSSGRGAPLALILGLAAGFAFLIGLALGAGVLQPGEAFGSALAASALSTAPLVLLHSPKGERRC